MLIAGLALCALRCCSCRKTDSGGIRMAIGFTHVAITPFDKRARHHGCCARRKTHSGGIMVAEGFTHVAMTPFNVLRACSDFDHTVRALNFGAPHFPTPHLKGAGLRSRRPGSRADFGRGPSPRPGATRQLRQTHSRRVKKSSQRDSFQERALQSSEARRLSFSALQVNLEDDFHLSAVDCLSAV